MFAELAPRMREKGWRVDHPDPRRPEAAGDLRLERMQQKAADRGGIRQLGALYRELRHRPRLRPGRCHRHRSGLDRPGLAARAWDVTKDILGETPLLRVGRPPKRLALYRREPGLVIDGKAFMAASNSSPAPANAFCSASTRIRGSHIAG